MDDHLGPETGMTPQANPAVTQAIRSSTMGLMIGGAICLYFGFSLLVETTADKILFTALKIVGIAFVLAGAWAWTGSRASMLMAAITEAAFALVALTMSVTWTLEARAMGTWNPQVILLLILVAISVAGARRSWELYRAAGRP